MSIDTKKDFEIFSDPLKMFNSMLDDIEKAEKCIYLEIYKFANDSIGAKFRDALTRKSKQGLDIKLLIDSWGASVGYSFFSELIRNGGEVRFFKRLKFNYNWLTKHHSRNHRKLLIIDNHISYLGSANITAYSLTWRELVIRFEGTVATTLKRSFFDSRRIYNKLYYNTKKYSRILNHGEYKFIRDVPSITRQRIKKKFEEIIRSAKKEIFIETPYFLPGFMLRKLLMDASKRGVQVTITTPKKSDVTIVDILRSKYLGQLHKSGINLKFYLRYNLHAKLMIVDREIIALGSSNFDYRSFRYMHEVMLLSKKETLITELLNHVNTTLEDCEDFDYDKWRMRPAFHKLLENMLVPFRHLL